MAALHPSDTPHVVAGLGCCIGRAGVPACGSGSGRRLRAAAACLGIRPCLLLHRRVAMGIRRCLVLAALGAALVATGAVRAQEVSPPATTTTLPSEVLRIVGEALRTGFLPAAPVDALACERCDYGPVCGPWEWLCTQRKPPERLALLSRLRALP